MTGAFFASSARAAATLAAIMKSSTSRCASSRSRGAIDMMRPFSSSITRRSGMSSSSGSRLLRAASKARQRPTAACSAVSTSSLGNRALDLRHRAGRRGDFDLLLSRRIDRRLRILVGNVCSDANLRSRESPAFERAVLGDLEVAGHRRPHLALLQRADVGRQFLGQHRHDAVGEIDAVAARPRLAVELGAGADVEADVGDGDDRLPAALIVLVVVGRGPDGVVMVARVGGVDGDDRQMRQVLALAELLLRHPMRLVDRLLPEFVAQAVLVDRDQAEAARRERVAEHRIDAGGHARRPARDFAQHEVAGLGVLQVADRQLAPLLLLDRSQPEALALLAHHAEHQLGRAQRASSSGGRRSPARAPRSGRGCGRRCRARRAGRARSRGAAAAGLRRAIARAPRRRCRCRRPRRRAAR